MDGWLSSGYATFSSMFSESNSALSWNSMPILLRMSNSCFSRIVEMSWPKTKTLPDSGLVNPIAVFSSTVLPLPAAPRMMRDSPSYAANEMSRNATSPSNETVTFSKRRTGVRVSAAISYPAWLTKILVISTSSTKISTVATTIACVVDRPTPCVPPVVRKP